MVNTAILVEDPILEGAPIRAISYLEPEDPSDSGYAVFSGPPNSSDRGMLVHLDCFIDDHPEAGQGMDVARRHGEAIRTGDRWMTGSG